ncbi:MAG: hypothetical protein HYT34_02475 [Candidatus Ryanbacteria bacterium]|nr:hypothetical protein [Candidatus Ryanbacteria bacterium]
MSREEAKEMLHRFIEMENRLDREPDFNLGYTEERFKRFEDFEKMEREFRGDFPGFPDRSERAPGGCSSPEECMKYCLEHREACGLGGPGMNFGAPGPGRLGDGGRPGGPGGCASPEECAKYCQEHPDECKPPAGESFEYRAPESFRMEPMPPAGEFFPSGDSFQKPPEGFQGSYESFPMPTEENSVPHMEQAPAPQPGALGILLAPFITIINLVR